MNLPSEISFSLSLILSISSGLESTSMVAIKLLYSSSPMSTAAKDIKKIE